MTHTTTPYPPIPDPAKDRRLYAADHSHCLLIRCALYDAIYLHYDAMDACPACAQMPGQNWCPGCSGTHCAAQARYDALCQNLETFVFCDWHREGTPYPLTDQDRQTINAALPEAITYREARSGIEDRALLGAYRELATRTHPVNTGEAHRAATLEVPRPSATAGPQSD